MSDSAARPVTAVLPGLLLAMFLGAIDLTIMAPALPAIAQDLGGFNRIPVVVTGYLLAATVMMPIYGKLGDRFGRKPVMLAAIGLFVSGAAFCVFASSMSQLAIFRALQGLGGEASPLELRRSSGRSSARGSAVVISGTSARCTLLRRSEGRCSVAS